MMYQEEPRNYYDERDIMLYVRRQALLRNKQNKLELLESAIESQIELDIEFIMGLYDNYKVINTDYGFDLYVMATKDVWAYYVAFINASEDYTKFVADHIGYHL